MEKRNHSISLRLNDSEMVGLENFRARLQESGVEMSLSEVVRMSLKSVCKYVEIKSIKATVDISGTA